MERGTLIRPVARFHVVKSNGKLKDELEGREVPMHGAQLPLTKLIMINTMVLFWLANRCLTQSCPSLSKLISAVLTQLLHFRLAVCGRVFVEGLQSSYSKLTAFS